MVEIIRPLIASAQTSPNKIFNVPVISTIWLGQLVTEWMIEKGAHPIIISSSTVTSAVTSLPLPPLLLQGGCPTSRTSPFVALASSTTSSTTRAGSTERSSRMSASARACRRRKSRARKLGRIACDLGARYRTDLGASSQVVFTIKSGAGADAQTVETFISSAEEVRR